MQKIAPCLWFDGKAEEAMNFYTSIFKNSKVGNVTRYGEAGPGVNDSVMTATFEIEGQEFMALNGGPMFKFSPAISFIVHCKTQEEVDDFWAKLLEGGAPQQCGWLTDKFGVSWQIVPTILPEMLQDKDAEKTKRVMQAMLKMIKLDIEVLKQAYRHRGKKGDVNAQNQSARYHHELRSAGSRRAADPDPLSGRRLRLLCLPG
jgi:predicted 3-demethylubiquinone-9 3-methyltransferase (glyoxalase superfamily)